MMFCNKATAGRRTPKDGAENSWKSEAFLASQVFLNHTDVSSRKLSIWIRQRSGRKRRRAVLSAPSAAQDVRALEAEAIT